MHDSEHEAAVLSRRTPRPAALLHSRAMAKRSSAGFRWADLAEEHQKAVSHYTASSGTFPQYEPCGRQTTMYMECLAGVGYRPELCSKEKAALTACIDTTPMVRLPSCCLFVCPAREADGFIDELSPAVQLRRGPKGATQGQG
jgi:hypothetical protein